MINIISIRDVMGAYLIIMAYIKLAIGFIKKIIYC